MQILLIAEKGKRRPQALQACFLNSVSVWSFCRACPRERASLPQFTEMCHSPFISRPRKTQLMVHIKVTGWAARDGSLGAGWGHWVRAEVAVSETCSQGVLGPSGGLRWGFWGAREEQHARVAWSGQGTVLGRRTQELLQCSRVAQAVAQ